MRKFRHALGLTVLRGRLNPRPEIGKLHAAAQMAVATDLGAGATCATAIFGVLPDNQFGN